MVTNVSIFRQPATASANSSEAGDPSEEEEDEEVKK